MIGRILIVALACGVLLRNVATKTADRKTAAAVVDGSIRYDVSPENDTDATRMREIVIDSAMAPVRNVSTTTLQVFKVKPTDNTTVLIQPRLNDIKESVQTQINSSTGLAQQQANNTKELVQSQNYNVTSLIQQQVNGTKELVQQQANGTKESLQPRTNNATELVQQRPNTTTTTTEIVHTTSKFEVLHFTPHSYCYCDLIYGSCDINCCCDTDCSNHDLKIFTSCVDKATSSLIKPESILFDSSLFYVVIENVPSDYFYPERDALESEAGIKRSLRNRNEFTWHDENSNFSSMNAKHGNYDLTYKSLTWMYTFVTNGINSTEIKAFGLKNSAFNSLCTSEEPVEYLKAKETHCQIFVPNLTEACNNHSSLSYKHFYGERGYLFKVAQPIYNSLQKSEKIGLVTINATVRHCAAGNDGAYDCSGTAVARYPAWDSRRGVCRAVLHAVEYVVTQNGTRGVREVNVRFLHRDVAAGRGGAVYVERRFSVTFARVADRKTVAAAYERSGKPGYRPGKPVLVAGARWRGAGTDVPRPIVLPGSDGSDARCRLTAVNFNENVDVRCNAVVRATVWKKEESSVAGLAEYCHAIQNETMAVLGDYEGTLVSSLGDPNVSKWIQIAVVKPLTDDPCSAVANNIHVQVLYSYVGSFNDPQATIHGMLVNVTSTLNITEISQNNTWEIPIRSSVVFVDLTRKPVRAFAEPPTYEFRLPEDFYYPFLSNGTPFLCSKMEFLFPFFVLRSLMTSH